MKPEETIFDGISDSEMESIAGGTAEVQSESQGESAAGDGYAIKCCNNKGKQGKHSASCVFLSKL